MAKRMSIISRILPVSCTERTEFFELVFMIVGVNVDHVLTRNFLGIRNNFKDNVFISGKRDYANVIIFSKHRVAEEPRTKN